MRINEIEKYAKALINYRVVCKCGHSQVIPPQLDRTVCDWCGNFIFKDKKTEFKYRLKETIKQQTKQRETKEQLKDISDKNNLFNSELYVKKTMIFKQEYLNIIDGLASLNDMQIKDVLNQLLERAINELDDKTKEKAIKESKKAKTNNKTDKSIF